MDNLDTFRDRFKYGDVAVEKAIEILTKLKIPYKTCKESWGNKWNNEIDAQYGDLLILHNPVKPIWIDVKRNSVSVDSLNKFEGHYFWVFHHFVDHLNLLITKQEILSLDLPLHELASGVDGYKIGNMYSKAHYNIKHHRRIEDLTPPTIT